MKNISPLDKLEALLKERQKKSPSYLKILLGSVPHIKKKASEWFDYEANIAQKEIKLLESVMPDVTAEWMIKLRKTRAKFENASKSLDKIAEKVKKGKVASIGEIFEREPSRHIVSLPVSLADREEEEELNLASSFLDILDAAKDLEGLIRAVERDAKRTLTLRRLVKMELGKA